jgi:O-antigen/teichoic acid export membrane protein
VVSHGAAGEYAIAVQLATVVFVFVRGFQYAWPPLAYSIDSDLEASKLYSLVTTYFVLATGVVVAAVALLGRWLVRLLAHPEYFGAHAALPWLALGWTLYGLYQVMIVITGRARVMQRNIPAAAGGLAVNVVLLFVLVPSSGLDLGLAGAGIALCGAYVAMVAIMHLLTRGVFAVDFEWSRLGRLAAILAGVAVSGELLLPTDGLTGLLLRILWLAWIPALLALTRFFGPSEREQARALISDGRRRVAAFRATRGDVEAYAEDSLRDI